VGDELWIGSRRGLTYLHGDSWTLLPWSSLPTKFSGLKRGPITALDYSIYDNTLFGAIRGRDLFYLKGEHWDEIPLPLEIARIHALSVGSNGLVWLSTDAGLWSLEERHRFHQVVGGGAGILCTTQVGEEIWCGTESGVLTIHSSKGVRRKGLFAHRVWDLEPTMDGSVWAGTSDGAYRFTHGRWHALPRLHGARTHTIHQAGDGALWFGTDQGIMRFDGFGIYWASRANHRLPHDTVRSIAETSRGMIWIGTQGGLVRFQA
jgi:ligand-binding sensor domain-containing protein